MSNKSKGSRAERELVEMLTKHGWRAARVAGSGVNDNSPCDIIAGKSGSEGCAIEAKSSKQNRIYITKAQIEDFVKFADMIGLKAVIAARFNREGWFFLDAGFLEDSGVNWVLSLDRCRKVGKRFAQYFS